MSWLDATLGIGLGSSLLPLGAGVVNNTRETQAVELCRKPSTLPYVHKVVDFLQLSKFAVTDWGPVKQPERSEADVTTLMGSLREPLERIETCIDLNPGW